MTSLLVSFSQAQEDIRLFQALSDVDPSEGFYIDIGANDPQIDSVTKLFYDCGWRGINVDASPEWMKKLRQARDRDSNVEIAVSDHVGEIVFYNDPKGGLGTTVDEIAAVHSGKKIELSPVRVSCTTLAQICDAHDVKDVHFLKIDVEGAERAVLAGMNFTRHRPWILCIESHFPNQPEIQLYDEWEDIILNEGYKFAYTDMINRYYVAPDHEHRIHSLRMKNPFCIPVSVLIEISTLRNQIQSCEQRLSAIRKITEMSS